MGTTHVPGLPLPVVMHRAGERQPGPACVSHVAPSAAYALHTPIVVAPVNVKYGPPEE